MRTLDTGRVASLVAAAALVTSSALAQSAIPPNLTQLRPIQCIAYDPKPSDFFQTAYFDSDFFNSDFTAIWGDDGQAGARKDLATFAGARLNMLHIYNWNAQRTGHTAFLDAAQQLGIKVMIPISNFTAQTITGTTDCPTCPKGYQAAFDLVKGISRSGVRRRKQHAAPRSGDVGVSTTNTTSTDTTPRTSSSSRRPSWRSRTRPAFPPPIACRSRLRSPMRRGNRRRATAGRSS